MSVILAEYIWLDGAVPVRRLRSKTRVLAREVVAKGLDALPKWNFDGSSTYQSKGSHSDLQLQPVYFCADPLRGEGNLLVLCEVLNPDGSPHASNSRAALRAVMRQGGADLDAWVGFEQEYTLMKAGRPLGFPEYGEPAPQGPYYCSVGTATVFGRDFVERHTRACIDAGLAIFGANGEVMPGQWEFQVGYRGIAGEAVDPLSIADQLWVARWLLDRIGETFGLEPSLCNKPVIGDWNGAGCHTNFSTRAMREEDGLTAIEAAIALLGRKHDDHIRVYGHDLASRLTGAHETCHIGEFRYGVSDRGSSIRIPLHVKEQGRGYFEDRRPGANCDPYQVVTRLIQTICDMDDDGIELGDWSLDAILAAGASR